MSPVRRAFVILGSVAGAIAFLLVVAQDSETLKVRSAYYAGDPHHTDYVAALVGTAPSTGNRYDVLTNGDQIYPAMLEAIQRAARRISFETYVYRSGEAANRFTTAFEAAARRGVRVNIVVDAIGGSGMKDDHVRRLREAGCRVAMFNFPSWYSMEHVNYRTHRKILVVDGEIAFTGGAGVADHWLGNADSPDHWRDTQVRMEGPIVRLVEAAFYENFVETDQEVTAELDDPPVAVDGRAASLAVRSSFTGGSNDLKRLYLLALASARRAIDITTPYFVLDDSIEWSLQEAIARGVKVRVLVEGDITDAMPVKYASRQAYDRLLRMGVEIYEYRPTMLHAKAVVIDGVWSMFGSANFDNRSLELNDELNIAVASPELALAFLRDFEQDLRRSSRLELSSWRQRSLLDKTRERFWSAFAEVF